MSTKLTWVDGIVALVWLLPLAYLAAVYAQLPETVALHFDWKGAADRYGPKIELVGAILLLEGVSLGVGLLVRFLPRIDPKKKVRYSQGAFLKISYALVFFLAGMAVAIIYSSLKGHFVLDAHFLYPAIGLLMAYLGNLFNSLKPNYFVGIRTPWTLENERVWIKTHQFGGRLWLPGGLLLAVLTFFLPERAAQPCFVAGVVVLCVAPILYSYIVYRQLKENTP